MISSIRFLTIIIYLLIDELHNIDIKWEVDLFIRFFNFISYVISIIIREDLILVMIGNIIS